MQKNNQLFTVLVASDDYMKDGVAQYIKQLAREMQCINSTVKTLKFNFKGFFNSIFFVKRSLKESSILHLQYPMEYWGNSINPGIAFFIAYFLIRFSKRAKVVLTLHEWNSMHLLRKFSIIPLLWVVDTIVFVSPSEESYFKSSILGRLSGSNSKKTHIIPIGVNLKVEPINKKTLTELRLEITEGDEKCLVIGYFGFIYDWKQPYKLLDMVAGYVRSGQNVKLVIAGDFPSDHVSQKNHFKKYIEALNIKENIYWPGYIEDESEVANLLSICNVVMALYEDGLTSRRGSFWYLVELGVPIITTKPQRSNEFTEELIKTLLSCSIKFVEPTVTKNNLMKLISMNYFDYSLPMRRSGVAPSWKNIALRHIQLFTNLTT